MKFTIQIKNVFSDIYYIWSSKILGLIIKYPNFELHFFGFDLQVPKIWLFGIMYQNLTITFELTAKSIWFEDHVQKPDNQVWFDFPNFDLILIFEHCLGVIQIVRTPKNYNFTRFSKPPIYKCARNLVIAVLPPIFSSLKFIITAI